MFDEITPFSDLPSERANTLQQQWQQLQSICQTRQLTLPIHSDFIDSLKQVWPASSFIIQNCLTHPELLIELFESGDILREYVKDEYQQRLENLLSNVTCEQQLMQCLRCIRRREMFRIAWRDLAGWADLNFTSRDLSNFADACITQAVDTLSHWLYTDFGQPVDQFDNPTQLMVIALGKLGARELNFSSDVDLMFAYPKEGEFEKTGKTYQQYFIRLSQQLVKVLSAFTADGFVFRVDMRLRPYGSSGALAMSFAQLREYYQTQGRDWERYALIKARVINGNKKHQRQLQSIIRRFVYRQYIDFSMIESLRALQQKISHEVKRHDLHSNIKRGPGGIREIEFIGQTYKLVRGGWQPRLQLRQTFRTMLTLREMGFVSKTFAEKIIDIYKLLRNIENRLQMQNDQQTHSLPDNELAKFQITYAMGFDSWQALKTEVTAQMQFVHNAFEDLIEKPKLQFENKEIQALQIPMAKIWNKECSDKKSKLYLKESQFDEVDQAFDLLQHLRESKACQSLSNDLLQRFNTIVPYILVLVAQTKKPFVTLKRIINVLESVLCHPVYLALLSEHPAAMSQLVKLCSASPWITEQLAQYPALLDELLRPETLFAPPSLADLKTLLRQQLISIPEDNVSEQMHVLQVFKQIHMLRVASADVTDALPLMKVSDYLTDLATVVVQQVVKIVWIDLLSRYGCPTEDITELSFAVVAYGKLGGIELGYGSDLDLVFLHKDMPLDNLTNGEEPITVQQFYTRVGQQVLNLLAGQSAAGRLYHIDPRLRPFGNSGLLVSSMQAFKNYQQQQAWPWEHQALVRARIIVGSDELDMQFQQIRNDVLSQQRIQIELQNEVKQMRQRMREAVKDHYPEKFDLKQGIGGIADIEFLVQYAVLYWSGEYPELLTWTDNIRILESMGVVGLLSVKEVQDLQHAYRALRNAVHQASLQNRPAWIAEDKLITERQKVTEIFQRLIG